MRVSKSGSNHENFLHHCWVRTLKQTSLPEPNDKDYLCLCYCRYYCYVLLSSWHKRQGARSSSVTMVTNTALPDQHLGSPLFARHLFLGVSWMPISCVYFIATSHIVGWRYCIYSSASLINSLWVTPSRFLPH